MNFKETIDIKRESLVIIFISSSLLREKRIQDSKDSLSKMKSFTLLIIACILTVIIASEENVSGVGKRGKFS